MFRHAVTRRFFAGMMRFVSSEAFSWPRVAPDHAEHSVCTIVVP